MSDSPTIRNHAAFIWSVADLLHGDNLTFLVAYTAVGSIFAGLIYAISAISMPLMMDRSVDAVTAGLTSMRLVLSQMPVMVFWGFLITALVVLGHASWHAYKQVMSLVGPQG